MISKELFNISHDLGFMYLMHWVIEEPLLSD